MVEFDESNGRPFTGRMILKRQQDGREVELKIINGFMERIGERVLADFNRVCDQTGMSEKLRKE